METTKTTENSGATDLGAIRVRVRYAECDPMGVAHHASYAPWLEMGRTELLRDVGRSYAAMEGEGVFLVVTRLEIKYRRAIRYDDVIEVRTRVDQSRSGGVRIKHAYELVLIERNGAAPDTADPAVPTDGVVSVATTELACVDAAGKVRQLPTWLRQKED